MARDGMTMFFDITGELEMPRVECSKSARWISSVWQAQTFPPPSII